MKKIGIMGGSFDPIHNGHINLAIDAKNKLSLDKIIFMPAGVQPFKIGKKVTSAKDRLAMINLAIKGLDDFSISDIEIRNSGISYTYLSLREIRKKAGEKAEIYFITGTDTFLDILTWQHADELLTDNKFIVGDARPGCENSRLDSVIAEAKKLYGADVYKVDNRQFDISSSQIRQKVIKGEDISELVPKAVYDYIKENKLYHESDEEDFEKLFENLKEYVSKRVSAKRWDHIQKVADEAVKLCKMHGGDIKKAKIAGIFHDAAKEISLEESNELVKKYGLGDKYIDNKNLAHGKIASKLIQSEFGIKDEDIINAISYHTTGRAGMSKLEEIIFVADAIEPNRHYDGVDEIRKITYKDLDRGCYVTVVGTIESLYKRNILPIDDDTLEAEKYFKELLDKKEKGN